MDAGETALSDEAQKEQLRDTARHINRRALITALAITLLTLIFPTSGW